jgi:hypothetical protein
MASNHLLLPPGEGGGEGSCAMPTSNPHPNPLPEGEGTKSLPRLALAGEGSGRGEIAVYGLSPLPMIAVSPEAGKIFFALESQGFIQWRTFFVRQCRHSAHYIYIFA